MSAYKASQTHTLLEAFLRSRNRKVSVLQIGANDGINADFIRDRAIANDWFCVLVEPHPVYFETLKKNYDKCRRVFFENVACSNNSGSLELFYVKEVSEDKYWSTGIASFDKSHLLRHSIDEENISKVDVPLVSLNSLVEKYFLYDVDILVIDVEGHELSVFNSGEFIKFQPKLIIFEKHHLSSEDLESILKIVGDNYDYCEAEYDGFLFRVRNDLL